MYPEDEYVFICVSVSLPSSGAGLELFVGRLMIFSLRDVTW